MRIGIAFDIDGVLIKGKKVVPSALRALKRVTDERVPFVLLTNGGGTTEAAKAAELSRLLGAKIGAAQMVLAHSPMAPLAEKYSRSDSDAVLILGKDGCKDAAISYGFKHPILTEEILATCPEIWPFRAPLEGYKPIADMNRRIGAIFSFHDSKDWGRDIQIVCDLLRTNGDLNQIVDPSHHSHRVRHTLTLQQQYARPQLPIYFSNGDFVWSNNLPLTRFAQGSFRVALEGVYQRLSGGKKLEYIMYGKPYKSTYDFARLAIDAHAAELSLQENEENETMRSQRRYYGIGDNPESDIEGANRNGWTSVLVKTGVYEGGPHHAKHLVQDVEEAVDIILKDTVL
ncbi:HAD-like domain-containing protein [Obelidium mucronatum]|nr:HAD-like domain-containing protein [Obelidium mucronatum]